MTTHSTHVFYPHKDKSKASESWQDNVPVVSAPTLDCNSAHKGARRKLSGKTANYLAAIIPLLKMKVPPAVCAKSALMRACLHTCVYELSWLCILSLREPGVITRWKCPRGCRLNLWLRATSPHFIVSFFCLTEEKLLCCLFVLTNGNVRVANL